jgi:hypothetical protein
MKRMTSIVLAVALAACGKESSEPLTASEARDALPDASRLRIDTPAGSSSAAAREGTAQAALEEGTPSNLALATWIWASAVNGSVGAVLGVVRAVVTNVPPTSCEEDTCTWGPGSQALQPNDWRLTVTRVEAGHYAWALAGRSKARPADGFVTVITGNAFPTSRLVGHGDLTVDLDAADELSPFGTSGSGKIVVTNYDNRDPAKRTLEIQFLGTDDSDRPGDKVNAAYAYTDAAGGAGDLQVVARNLTTDDTLALRSRWNAAGAGRCDLSARSASGAERSVSQCWASPAERYAVVYQATLPAEPGDGGSEALCAFAPAAPPTIAAP